MTTVCVVELAEEPAPSQIRRERLRWVYQTNEFAEQVFGAEDEDDVGEVAFCAFCTVYAVHLQERWELPIIRDVVIVETTQPLLLLRRSGVEDFGADLVDKLLRQVMDQLDEVVCHLCGCSWMDVFKRGE